MDPKKVPSHVIDNGPYSNMDLKERQVNNALNALWTIEEGLRARGVSKPYADYVDIVKQFLKYQRDKINHQSQERD